MAVFESSLPRELPSPQGRRLARPEFPAHARERDLLTWLGRMFALDRHYHTVMATLTASENYPSRLVRAAAAFTGAGHYFFDAPAAEEAGEWAFPSSAALPALQQRFLQQMRSLFGAGIADWRPNGGSTCEQAIVMAACRHGDALVEIGASDGGHFGAAELAKKLGVETFEFPMVDDLIDPERTLQLVERHPHIRLLLVQPSHTRRPQPIKALAQAVQGRVTIAVDVSHTAGLVAGGILPQPLKQGADILTFNSHKTLAGPNKGVIAFADPDHPLAERVWHAVCPELQSNSHAECLPGLVLALEELALYGLGYAKQTVANARTLARVLDDHGLPVAGIAHGGTDTHQVHLVIGSAGASNALANVRLPQCGFRTNSVMIPGTGGQFGLRLGTQALTRRGLTEPGFVELGHLLAQALSSDADANEIRSKVARLLSSYPLFPLRFSFDTLFGEAEAQQFVARVFR